MPVLACLRFAEAPFPLLEKLIHWEHEKDVWLHQSGAPVLQLGPSMPKDWLVQDHCKLADARARVWHALVCRSPQGKDAPLAGARLGQGPACGTRVCAAHLLVRYWPRRAISRF